MTDPVMTTSDEAGYQEDSSEADYRLRACLHAIATREVRKLAARGFSYFFAPWRIGGCRPFFVPKWVPSFERAHSGFVYEVELMVGRGALLFYQGTGAVLNAQMEKWSRRARGGKMERHVETGLYRFTPDRDHADWQHRLIPAPVKRLVLPSEPAPRQALIVPGGGR